MVDDDEIKKLYDAVLKLNKKVAELDQRNIELEGVLASVNPKTDVQQLDETILDEEKIIADAFGIGGHRNVSLPNGGAVKVKSLPMCSSGRHMINDNNSIRFCSKCNAVVCAEHVIPLDAPTCSSCVKSELKGFSQVELYILYALAENISLAYVKTVLNVPRSEFYEALSSLRDKNLIRRYLLFNHSITLSGADVLALAKCVYDFPLPGKS